MNPNIHYIKSFDLENSRCDRKLLIFLYHYNIRTEIFKWIIQKKHIWTCGLHRWREFLPRDGVLLLIFVLSIELISQLLVWFNPRLDTSLPKKRIKYVEFNPKKIIDKFKQNNGSAYFCSYYFIHYYEIFQFIIISYTKSFFFSFFLSFFRFFLGKLDLRLYSECNSIINTIGRTYDITWLDIWRCLIASIIFDREPRTKHIYSGSLAASIIENI